MSEWIQGGYDGLFYLGKEATPSYRGYVVLTSEEENIWFAYTYSGGAFGKHTWLAEGSKEETMRALEGEI